MKHHKLAPGGNTTEKTLDGVFDDAVDTPFDSALLQHFHSEAEPDDDGFSERVVAALPARVEQRCVRWLQWVEPVQWAAISLAACGAAVLMSSRDGRIDAAHLLAAYSLIGLLVFWSIPSRFSRG